MKWISILFAALMLALAAPSVLADDAPAPPMRLPHYYTLVNLHREDAAITATDWTTFGMTHTSCEMAAVTTLIEAWDAGWDIVPIIPAVLDMERAFPAASPCSVTLGLR